MLDTFLKKRRRYFPIGKRNHPMWKNWWRWVVVWHQSGWGLLRDMEKDNARLWQPLQQESSLMNKVLKIYIRIKSSSRHVAKSNEFHPPLSFQTKLDVLWTFTSHIQNTVGRGLGKILWGYKTYNTSLSKVSVFGHQARRC